MTIKDGVLDGGEFAHIYFVDWDHVRARRRQLNVTVMGTTEDVGDRKWEQWRGDQHPAEVHRGGESLRRPL